MKIVPLLIGSACLILARPFAALGQTNPTVQLPRAAQEAMEKGLIAAKQQEYLLALRFFHDARKIAPVAPVLLFNMGLAESRIAGRELRAMTWFGAYLEASPGAPNAVVVKEQIRMLDVKNQGNLSRLIRTAEDAARQMGPGQVSALSEVADVYSRNRDFEAAIQIVRNMHPDSDYERERKGSAQSYIVQIQALEDIAGAQKTAASIQHADSKDRAHFEIANAQSRVGDFAGAQNTADRIQDASSKDWALYYLATAQAKAGDIVGAKGTAERMQIGGNKYKVQGAIVAAQVTAGDIAGGEKTIDNILEAGWKNIALSEFAVRQAELGDIAGSKKTSGRILDAGWQNFTLKAIAGAQAKAGDIAGAKKTTDSIQGATWKDGALSAIAEAQAKTGDIASAQRTTDSIQQADWKDRALRAIARAKETTNPVDVSMVKYWIEQNDRLLNEAAFLDFGSYLKSLPADNAKGMVAGLSDAAEKIVIARGRITSMLKQQAERRAKL